MTNRLRHFLPHLFHKQTGSFYRAIKGALNNCIDEHGPITKRNIPSAVKRIFGAIRCHNQTFEKNTGCSNNHWLEIYKSEIKQEVDENGMVQVEWASLKSIIDKAIERGEYIQYFEGLYQDEV